VVIVVGDVGRVKTFVLEVVTEFLEVVVVLLVVVKVGLVVVLVVVFFFVVVLGLTVVVVVTGTSIVPVKLKILYSYMFSRK
jgi:hypothetical protein